MKTIFSHPVVLVSLCGSLLLAGFNVRSEEPAVTPLPRVKTIAVFKNGIGFALRGGEVHPRDGWAELAELPAASLGTFWVGTSPTNAVAELISARKNIEQSADALTLDELLSANVGKRVAVNYMAGPALTRLEGTLISIPLDRKPAESVPLPDFESSRVAYVPPAEIKRSEIVLVRPLTNGPIISLNRSSIQSAEFPDGSSLKTVVSREIAVTRVHFSSPAKSVDLAMSYLEKGIVWSPSYRINIEGGTNADLALDAVLANDAEDLDNTEVAFVVGYPNFLYADTLTSLSVRQSVAGYVRALLSGQSVDSSGMFGNAMAQSFAYNTAGAVGNGRAGVNYPTSQPMAGEASEDLYFYRRAAVSLKKGDRARYEVFSASVPCEHIYHWEVNDTMSVDDRGYRRDAAPRPSANEPRVWHMLRLHNTTQLPWTTAPAFTLNGALPLAEDTLTYAPPGAETTMKLTVASDVHPEQTHLESGRKPVSIDGRAFDEVTVEGKLKVTNWRSKESCIVIEESLTGEISNPGDAKVTKGASKVAAVNPTSNLYWEFHLPAGQARELNYQYKILVAR